MPARRPSAALLARGLGSSENRSPAMDTACPSRPAHVAPTVRDDVAIEAIAAAEWDARAGGTPLASHAFLCALHATGCASRGHRLDAALSHGVARRSARRRTAAVREEPFVRRVRFRLGVGGRVPPSRAPLLPQARGRDSIHAGAGTAPVRPRRRNARRADPRGTAPAPPAARAGRRAVFVAARALSHARPRRGRSRPRAWSSGTDCSSAG